MSNQKIVHIKHEPEKTTLSKAQKKFNSLIKKIEVQKKILQEWEDSKPKFQEQIHGEYQTLSDSYNEVRVAMVHLFDQAHGDSFFKKTDKAKLKNLISDMTAELIAEGIDELKEIYNRYNDTDFDTENDEREAEIGDVMKSMMEEMFGFEFDQDADLSSPEKMQEALQQKMQAEKDRFQEKQSKRKKSAKQLEKEAKEKEEEQNASKSIREVFRKLVAVLHPDREPDEAERERKTGLMQRVNEAYSKKDLLQLLALQLEIEQIDQTQLNTIAEDRLKHFNKILQEQLDELEQEIREVEFPFRMQLNVPPYLKLTPKQVLQSLLHSILGLKLTIRQAENELKDFQNLANLKAALKTYRL
jgi:hypothetical protein